MADRHVDSFSPDRYTRKYGRPAVIYAEYSGVLVKCFGNRLIFAIIRFIFLHVPLIRARMFHEAEKERQFSKRCGSRTALIGLTSTSRISCKGFLLERFHTCMNYICQAGSGLSARYVKPLSR